MTFSHNIPRQVFTNSASKGIMEAIHPGTSSKIQMALQGVYTKHDIEPDSELGILLKNGLIKLIIGMHHMADAVAELNKRLPQSQRITSKATVKRIFHEDFARACDPDENTYVSHHIKERVLLLELGKSKVLSTYIKRRT